MIDRRTFLKATAIGAGSGYIPGFADRLAHAVQDGLPGPLPGVLGGAPRRFIFIRKSNGLRPAEVALPTFSEAQVKLEKEKQPLEADLRDHELPGWLNALEPYKANLSILQGLSSKMSENGHSSFSSVLGAFKSGNNSLSGIKRATIDFELARLFPSPFGHVELALRHGGSGFATGIISGYSAPAPHQRNYCYADPQTAYDELFKSVLDPAAVDSDNSMLAFLLQEEDLKSRILRGYEKAKLSSHIDSIEKIRKRNDQLKAVADAIKPQMPKLDPVHAKGGPSATSPQKWEAMTDNLVAAIATGLTNVVTYTIDELSTPIKGLPGNESDTISIHEIGHGGGYSGVSADAIREKIRVGHVAQIKMIVDRLKAIPEDAGTMFDNTMIVYFPENGETHHSQGFEAPQIVVAGDNFPLDMLGRYIRLPYHATPGHKTIGNWYTTLLNAHGNPIKHYGDFDHEMDRKKLDQTGPIGQLMS
jgi:hypothetical protein